MSASPFLVVGAGIQGLAFALEAASRGKPVLVVERSETVGGQTRSFRYGDFIFDYGMHALVTKDGQVKSFLRRLLGTEYSSFRARAASWIGPNRLLRDEAAFRQGGLFAPQPRTAAGGWHCMRVAAPPTLIYPRNGGFGSICDRMLAAVKKKGGRVLLNTRLSPGDFGRSRGRLVDVRIGQRRLPIAGCFWSAPAAPRPAKGDELQLFHYLVKGRAPMPYHWIRIAVENPLLPSIVYYPSNFSAKNAPPGHYGVAAAIALRAGNHESGGTGALLDWYAQSPADFLPWLTRFLARAGFFSADRVIDVRQERLELPVDQAIFAPTRTPSRVAAENLWTGAAPREPSGESLAAIQLAGAQAALKAALAGAP